MVLWIWLQFWWMIPLGVKYNHTKFERETGRWRPGTGSAGGGPQFQKTAVWGQKQPFWGQKRP